MSDAPKCLGDYNFKHIAFYAVKRFIDGDDLIMLMEQAGSGHAKEEVALVCKLDIEDETIMGIDITCRYDNQCQVHDCRSQIKKMILEPGAS